MGLMDHSRMSPQTWQCTEQVLASNMPNKVQGVITLNHSVILIIDLCESTTDPQLKTLQPYGRLHFQHTAPADDH